MNGVVMSQDLAERAALDLELASPEQILLWAADHFGGRLCLTSSMADAVVIDIASRVIPGIDVLFLDTGYHFAETLGTRDAVSAVYPVTVVNVTPEQSVAEQDAEHGPRLYERDPDRCCALRKVAPLARALRDYDAWVTGLRRDEAATRRHTPVIGYDQATGKIKINPIARWDQQAVDSYVVERGVLLNPLLMDGYSSVGCAPCTRRTSADEDLRAGRWAGRPKTECGIHR
jgi:phosphoadenosine phosphosulfate reductase